MTIKEFIKKKWWAVAIIVIFAIAHKSSSDSNDVSNSSSVKYEYGPKCKWCGRTITSKYYTIDNPLYRDLKFCGIDHAHFYSSSMSP